MRLILSIAMAFAGLAASPALASEQIYSVSCSVDSNGRIVPARHEPRDIYDHAEQFAGRSHQAPNWQGRAYAWRGRVEITDDLYTAYRALPRFLGRRAFERVGSTDGVVYVYVQSAGCLFDRYLPRASRRTGG